MGSPLDKTLEEGGKEEHGRAGVGASVGKYRLERFVGAGGMGIVWAAHDPDLERTVAIKVLGEAKPSAEARQRFLREARTMAKLKHPNVLTVYEVDSDGDIDFIAMELVDGESLDAWCKTSPPREAIWSALFAAGHGLAEAHRAGLVHRDFKPHNVLRSASGRVLVTDFGLAMAEGAPIDHATESSAAAATLTPAGVVLGTPAYMAPEQFHGAACDARSDQFAYCVTAWEMLTGARPFRGDSRDELRAAASAGVKDLASTLPRAVHRVLARGLDPDPAQRWPDLDALLDALEHAHDRPRRLRRAALAAGLAALVVAGVIVGAVMSSSPAAIESQPTACELPAESEMARAWTPALRANTLERFHGNRSVEVAIADLDAFTQRWIADYARACTAAPSTRTFTKLGCLLGERDQLLALVQLVPSMPTTLDQVEVGGILPRVEACDGEIPVAPPVLPEDPQKRAAIQALRPQLYAVYFAPPARLAPVMPQIIARAESIGWTPLVAEMHHAYGILAKRMPGAHELSREQFELAHAAAHGSLYFHLLADTSTDLVEAELTAARDPRDDQRFGELVARARAEVHNAGDDPSFVARIEGAEATVARSRGRLDAAIAGFDRARSLALAGHEFTLASTFAGRLVGAVLERGHPGDEATAEAALREIDRAAAAVQIHDQRLAEVWLLLARFAQRHGDLARAHELADRLGRPTLSSDTIEVAGRVTDDAGNPVPAATIVAWRGELEGDAKRAYFSPRFTGAIATTAADGSFTMRAPRDGAVIAELAGRRSSPRVLGSGAPTLVLAAPRTIPVSLGCDDPTTCFSVHAAARYALASDTQWTTRAPFALPPGDATLSLIASTDGAYHRIRLGALRDPSTVRWPVGVPVDVIARGGGFERVVLLRGTVAPATRADIDQLTRAAPEVAVSMLTPVGAGDQVPAHLRDYQRGDWHAILRPAPGAITVCAIEASASTRPACRSLVVRDPQPPIVVQR